MPSLVYEKFEFGEQSFNYRAHDEAQEFFGYFCICLHGEGEFGTCDVTQLKLKLGHVACPKFRYDSNVENSFSYIGQKINVVGVHWHSVKSGDSMK